MAGLLSALNGYQFDDIWDDCQWSERPHILLSKLFNQTIEHFAIYLNKGLTDYEVLQTKTFWFMHFSIYFILICTGVWCFLFIIRTQCELWDVTLLKCLVDENTEQTFFLQPVRYKFHVTQRTSYHLLEDTETPTYENVHYLIIFYLNRLVYFKSWGNNVDSKKTSSITHIWLPNATRKSYLRKSRISVNVNSTFHRFIYIHLNKGISHEFNTHPRFQQLLKFMFNKISAINWSYKINHASRQTTDFISQDDRGGNHTIQNIIHEILYSLGIRDETTNTVQQNDKWVHYKK